ncbi:MAG TPA: hypothetical protein DCW33_01835 [Proteobacteria bacterium]|nr:hypothetical protein [Pseudomonadota bacterium]
MLFQISLIATVVAAYFAKEWYQFSNPDCEISGRSLGKRDRFWKPIVKVLQLGNVDEQRIRAKELEKGKRRTTVDEMKTCRKEHETHQHNINYMKFSAGVAVAFAIAGFVRASRRDSQSSADDEMKLDALFIQRLNDAYLDCQNAESLTHQSNVYTELVTTCSQFIRDKLDTQGGNIYIGAMQCAAMLIKLHTYMAEKKVGNVESNRIFLKNNLFGEVHESLGNMGLSAIIAGERFNSCVGDHIESKLDVKLAKRIIDSPKGEISNILSERLTPTWYAKITNAPKINGAFGDFINQIKTTVFYSYNARSLVYQNKLTPLIGVVDQVKRYQHNKQFDTYKTDNHSTLSDFYNLYSSSVDIENIDPQFVKPFAVFVGTFIHDAAKEIKNKGIPSSPGSPGSLGQTLHSLDELIRYGTEMINGDHTGHQTLSRENLSILNGGNGERSDNQADSPSTNSDHGRSVPSPSMNRLESS